MFVFVCTIKVVIQNKIIIKAGGCTLRNLVVRTTCPGGAISLKEVTGTATYTFILQILQTIFSNCFDFYQISNFVIL